MKAGKIALATLGLVASLFAVTVVASAPASAAVSCNAEIRADQGSTSHVGSDAGEYQWEASLWYQKCIYSDGSGANIYGRNRVNGYRMCMTRVHGNDGLYNFWWVDPNVIGSWNPPRLSFPNDGPAVVCKTWGKGGDAETWVNASAPSNERCLGSHLTQTRNLGSDFNDDTPSICVSFLNV